MAEGRPHRRILSDYYGGSEVKEPAEPPKVTSSIPDDGNPFNLDGPSFDADQYTQKLIKEASLSQLMAKESEINRQIGSLDSDMQTLVYENYNKFISATDTIRKMRVDFRAMEDEMDQLASKMTNIAAFSSQISDTLGDRRAKIGKLSGTHALLKKLQFLFELPTKLKECIADDDLAMGVKYYVRAQRVLDQYEHMASFQGIKQDCDSIMVELKKKLLEKLSDPETSPEDLSNCVHLLFQLQEPQEQLCDSYLSTAQVKLDETLSTMDKQVKLANGEKVEEVERPSDAFESAMDILEFVDLGCNAFLGDLSLVIAGYSETFLPSKNNNLNRPELQGLDEKMANDKLTGFVNKLIGTFFNHLRARFRTETESGEDTAMFVRALDRFHRRLQAMCRLLTTVDFSRAGLDLVLEASELHCKAVLKDLESSFQDSLLEARQVLAAPPLKRQDPESGEVDLAGLNMTLLTKLAENVRNQLSGLGHFIDPELTFAVKTYFRARFCRFFVREGVLVALFSHVIDTVQNFSTECEKTTPPALLLLLSRFCIDLQKSTTQYLLALVDEQFFIDDTSGLTSLVKVNDMFKTVSQGALDHYVKLEGGVLSQMLKKSVETRDWLNSVEPRTVRAVMKRVVEEATTIDRQVGKLYEEGDRKARSDSSSRRTRFSQSAASASTKLGRWTQANSSGLDTSLASNIQKMFNEKIEIFSPVEFSKVSILTGIVKIALKTLLECVRLRTFSKYGFQQIQVDCHYLHLYLWRFVSDEKLVTFLLDEVMTSAVHRCPEPVPMEPSVVDVICDRG